MKKSTFILILLGVIAIALVAITLYAWGYIELITLLLGGGFIIVIFCIQSFFIHVGVNIGKASLETTKKSSQQGTQMPELNYDKNNASTSKLKEKSSTD
jgi:uncharacterized membrane protein